MTMAWADAAERFDLDETLRTALHGDMQAINACIECCDAHADADPDRVALRFERRDGTGRTLSFGELRELSARFAGLLAARGIEAGDRVGGLLPRVPELLVTILGTWRAGAVYQPLFTAFGPKAIEHRTATAGTKLIVTDAANRPKLAELSVPATIVVTNGGASGTDLDFDTELAGQSPDVAPVMRGGDDPFLIMFTSGTTGPAKPVMVPLRAIAAFKGYMAQAVDLRADDRFWNIADPGWAYGLYYAVTGPLSLGVATTFYDGPFTAESTYGLIAKLGITNLAGAPTAYRLLLAAGPELALPVKGRLRAVSSAGEPLNPEVIRWFAEHLDVTIHDHYGQTELGMVLCNHHGLSHPVQPGAAGFAVPGHRIVVVNEDTLEELPVGEPGILAVDRRNSPLFWFDGYWNMPTRSLTERYYLSGDTVELNDDGSISFVGRSDDVITSSGYRIGPFDVESALIEHKAVVETAVVGKPDPERTEIVKAFVVLKPAYEPTAELAEELRRHVRARLSAHAYPREIEFVDELPKTPSGKLQRFILRNQEKAKAAAAG